MATLCLFDWTSRRKLMKQIPARLRTVGPKCIYEGIEASGCGLCDELDGCTIKRAATFCSFIAFRITLASPNASSGVLAPRVFEAVTLYQVGNGLPHVVKAFLGDYLRIPPHCVHQINLLGSIGHFVENRIRVISPRDVDSRLDESLPGDDAGWLSGEWVALHRKSMTCRHSRTQVTEVTQHEMVSEPQPV